MLLTSPAVVDVGKCRADAVRNDLPASDGHVVKADQSAADLGGCNLGNVQWHNHGRGAHAEPDDKTAHGHLGDRVRSGLQHGANDEEGTADVDGDFAAKLDRKTLEHASGINGFLLV